MNAIKAGIITPTVREQLQKAERKKEELQGLLLVDEHKTGKVLTALPRVVQVFKQKLGSLEIGDPQHIAKLRQHVRALIGGEIILQPVEGKGLVAELQGDYSGLLEFILDKSKFGVVAGAGFEPATFRL